MQSLLHIHRTFFTLYALMGCRTPISTPFDGDQSGPVQSARFSNILSKEITAESEAKYGHR